MKLSCALRNKVTRRRPVARRRFSSSTRFLTRPPTRRPIVQYTNHRRTVFERLFLARPPFLARSLARCCCCRLFSALITFSCIMIPFHQTPPFPPFLPPFRSQRSLLKERLADNDATMAAAVASALDCSRIETSSRL